MAFKPTDEQRNMVAIAAGGGMSHEELAISLGIARETLETHFEHELAEGAYLKRSEVVAALHAAALKGNASAAREYLARAPDVAVPPTPQADDAAPRKSKLGKKEQADEDAKEAGVGTDWDPLLKPARRRPTVQ